MEKSETMKRYEAETGKSAMDELYSGSIKLYMPTSDYIAWLEVKAHISDEAIEAFQEIIRNQCDEISALKENAESYGRIMSGGRKTLKEWANIFGMPVAVDKNFGGIVFDEMPELLRTVEAWRAPHGYVGLIPSLLIDFNGDWKDSLTVPDGWEEK